MEMFGYVCSPHCQNKAELQGIEVPFYEGRKTVVELQQRRKIGLVSGSIAAFVALLLGVWCWYEWFGSRPGVKFSVRFDTPAYSGKSILTPDNQIVFLHGGTLARHDMKQKKQLWSRDLIDHKAVADAAAASLREMEQARARAIDRTGEGGDWRLPLLEDLVKGTEKAAAASLELFVSGQNVWVSMPGRVARYDWTTGEPKQEIPVEGYGVVERGNELIASTEDASGQESVTHINLATGETRSEQTKGKVGNQAPQVASAPTPGGPKALDPANVAARVPQMSFPEKLALPATLSVQRNQQRTLDELNPPQKAGPAPGTHVEHLENFFTVPAKDGDIQFSSMLLEERIVARKAMKDPPKKSALNGETTVTKTLEVANEILNEMQRDRGGDTVVENQSRYLVTIRRPDVRNATDWRGEVVGPPALFPLNTVTVLVAGKTIIAFDKFNKKLWESTLAYSIPEGFGLFGQDDPAAGQGPLVERGDTLYIFDEGVLSAFNLVTGEARWRLPSVGIAGLFFDDEGNVYANTTTASHENIKYSRQIDISSKVDSSIMKIESRNGTILWNTQPGGVIRYLSGKFIYTLETYMQDEKEEADEGDNITTIRTIPSHTRIRRINPKNGTVMWEHYQKRGALDVHFDKNTIQIVFKNEIQVLKFLSM